MPSGHLPAKQDTTLNFGTGGEEPGQNPIKSSHMGLGTPLAHRAPPHQNPRDLQGKWIL